MGTDTKPSRGRNPFGVYIPGTTVVLFAVTSGEAHGLATDLVTSLQRVIARKILASKHPQAVKPSDSNRPRAGSWRRVRRFSNNHTDPTPEKKD